MIEQPAEYQQSQPEPPPQFQKSTPQYQQPPSQPEQAPAQLQQPPPLPKQTPAQLQQPPPQPKQSPTQFQQPPPQPKQSPTQFQQPPPQNRRPPYQQPEQQSATPGFSDSSRKKRRVPLFAKILVGAVLVIGITIGAIVLVSTLVSSGVEDQDFFTIGKDEVPSVMYILGEKRIITSVNKSNQRGITKWVYQYSVPANQSDEMETYALGLIDNHGFYSTTPHSFTNPTGRGLEFAKESVDDGYLVVVHIDYDLSGYTIALMRAKGTLTVSEQTTEPGSEPSAGPSAEPTSEPTSEPTPDLTPETSDAAGGIIPSGGGVVQVNGATELDFTPDQDGLWVLFTTENGHTDPIMTILTPNGSVILQDDNGMGDLNSRLIVFLDRAVTYTVIVLFAEDEAGSASVIAKAPLEIPSDGDEINVTAPQGFIFTPDQSGDWEFRTSNNGAHDPTLDLYDYSFNLIASDDDSADGYNALISFSLDAGETYYLYAGFYEFGPVDYVLTAIRR